MPTATIPARRRTRQLEPLTRLSAIDAIARVRDLELRPAVEPCDGGPGDHGLVLAQDPAAGSEVSRGQLVTLLIGDCAAAASAAAGRHTPPAPRRAPRPRPPASRRSESLACSTPFPLPAVDPEPELERPADPKLEPPAEPELEPPAEPELLAEAESPAEVEPEPRPPESSTLGSMPAGERVADPGDHAGLVRAGESVDRSERPRQVRLPAPGRRLLLVASGALVVVAFLLVVGAELPHLSGRPALRGPIATTRPRHRGYRDGPQHHRAIGRPRRRPAQVLTARSTAAAAVTQLADPAVTERPAPHPAPESTSSSPASPPSAGSPDPVSPIGPAPGPPPSLTGGTP